MTSAQNILAGANFSDSEVIYVLGLIEKRCSNEGLVKRSILTPNNINFDHNRGMK